MMPPCLSQGNDSCFFLSALSQSDAARRCSRNDLTATTITIWLLLFPLPGCQHLSDDLIVLVEEQGPRKLFFLFSLKCLRYLLVFLYLKFLISLNSINLRLIPRTLYISYWLDVDRLLLMLLLQLHQLACVILLRYGVAHRSRLALNTTSLNRNSFNLTTILCITPKISDAVASGQTI